MKLDRWRTSSSAAAVLILSIALLFYVSASVQAAAVIPPQNVSQDSANSLLPRVAQDPSGNVHVVWDTTEGARQVRWRKGTWNGSGYTFGPSVVFGDVGSFQYSTPNIAVAPNGTVLAAWSNNFQIYVRQWNMGDAQPGGTPVAVMPGFDASIAVDSNNHFHIVSNGDFQVQYCEWNGSSCVKRDSFSRDNNANPDVAVDSANGVHVVMWGGGGAGIRYRYRPAGQEWGTIETIASGGNASSIAADGKGGVHIVWSQDYNIQYCRKTAAGCVDKQTLDGGSDLSPSVGATPDGNVVVMFYSNNNNRLWVAARENNAWSAPQNVGAGPTKPDVTGRAYVNRVSGALSLDYDIWLTTATPAGPPVPTPTPIPPISGSLTVNGGAAFTNQTGVSVSITRTSAAPAASYSIADDADPGAPSVAFSDPTMTMPFTLNVADGRCRAHAVTARLAGGQGVSPMFSGVIMYDPSAKGIVQAQNPNSPLNQPLNAIGNALVPTGDAAFTRQERMTLLIIRPEEECSGLKRYAIMPDGAPAPAAASSAWKDVPPEGYISALIQFTADAGQGAYDFDVYLQDAVDNVTATPYTASIIYDTEAPNVSGEQTGIPVTPSAKGGIAALAIGDRTITDNLYPGMGAGRQYWGLWVAVKQTSAGAPTDQEWDRYGQLVPGQTDGALSWNMARGMVDTFTPGSYTVYVRVLDGAGNGSAPLQSQPIQVSQLEYQGFFPLSQR
jgi:hypothetical protein